MRIRLKLIYALLLIFSLTLLIISSFFLYNYSKFRLSKNIVDIEADMSDIAASKLAFNILNCAMILQKYEYIYRCGIILNKSFFVNILNNSTQIESVYYIDDDKIYAYSYQNSDYEPDRSIISNSTEIKTNFNYFNNSFQLSNVYINTENGLIFVKLSSENYDKILAIKLNLNKILDNIVLDKKYNYDFQYFLLTDNNQIIASSEEFKNNENESCYALDLLKDIKSELYVIKPFSIADVKYKLVVLSKIKINLDSIFTFKEQLIYWVFISIMAVMLIFSILYIAIADKQIRFLKNKIKYIDLELDIIKQNEEIAKISKNDFFEKIKEKTKNITDR